MEIAAMDAFFEGREEQGMLCIALYDALKARLSDTKLRVMKTCVSFDDPKPYCYVSLPKRKTDRGAIVVTFGLRRRLEGPRIAFCTEAAPGRFTHHVRVTAVSELDAELMDWVREARAVKQIGGKCK